MHVLLMKQNFLAATFAMVFAAFVTGCASETTGPSETGNVSVNLLVGDTDVTAVNFVVTCSDSTVCPLNGQFNVVDDRTPPVWATIMDLPVGDPKNPTEYTITLTALDDEGAVLCTGSTAFTVLANDTVEVDVVLTCGGDGEELLGNVDIDATFEIIDGNNCPRLHFLNAVPNEVPPEGSEVTVLVSDADGDPLTTALTATSGSFEDPAAQSTTYTCGADGTQTIRVSVTDGDAACDKTKSFDVECGGASLVCEYVQDFEALDQESPSALSDDGWLIFGQVFDGSGAFKFDYGPFPAPNAAANPSFTFFSAIVTGEGGPDQGDQQLSVFNDYNCREPLNPTQGHFNGTDRVGSSVFQQESISADQVGKILQFSFDARRGNINDPTGSSTALAFIQTLDPGFTQTNFVQIDMTNLPETWARYSIELEIDASLVGQILEFGFLSIASNFEPSGVFYDNITFGRPGCGGGGGPGLELRPLPDIYTTGNAINYSPYRAQGPEVEPREIPSDEDILEDLGLLQTAGYDLLRLFGGDAVSEKILQLAAANFPEMRFQQGLFLEGLAPGAAADNCDSMVNDSQVETAIRLANTYSNVVTVSVGNETSFFAAFMPLNCLEGYITETRNNVTQPVTADDDYTFYAQLFWQKPRRRPAAHRLRVHSHVPVHQLPAVGLEAGRGAGRPSAGGSHDERVARHSPGQLPGRLRLPVPRRVGDDRHDR